MCGALTRRRQRIIEGRRGDGNEDQQMYGLMKMLGSTDPGGAGFAFEAMF